MFFKSKKMIAYMFITVMMFFFLQIPIHANEYSAKLAPIEECHLQSYIHIPVKEHAFQSKDMIDSNIFQIDVINVEQRTLLNINTGPNCAFINVVCTAITILIGFAVVFGRYKIEDFSNEEITTKASEYKKQFSIACVCVACASIFVLILTENLFHPLILADKWTILMVVFPIIQLFLLIRANRWNKIDDHTSIKLPFE